MRKLQSVCETNQLASNDSGNRKPYMRGGMKWKALDDSGVSDLE